MGRCFPSRWGTGPDWGWDLFLSGVEEAPLSSTGGFAQSPQANAINDKSCPNSTMSIHDSSGYARGAAQIPQANAINDKSHPNSTTNIHNLSGNTGGAAQIPLLQVTVEALPKFHR
jgi:hypothetical protein